MDDLQRRQAETCRTGHGQIVAPSIEFAYGEHRFASVDDLFGSSHLPDSVCAMALAWLGAAPKGVMVGRLAA